MSTLRLAPPAGPPIEITKDSVIIGRDPACDVVLPFGSVSRRHARIERRGEAFAIIDLGSANGTFLDSQRVTEALIKHGQEARFGSMSFKVEIEGEEAGTMIIGPPLEPHATVVQPTPMAASTLPRPRPAAPPPPQPRTGGPPPPPRGGPPPPPPVPRLPRVPQPAAPFEPIDAGEPGPPGPEPGPAAPEPARRGPVFWVALGCGGCLTLLLLLGGAAVLFFGGAGALFFQSITKAPVDAVRGELAEIGSANLDGAYAGLSSSYRARLSRREFETLVDAHPALKDNSESTFRSHSVENDRAMLKDAVLLSRGGVQEIVTFELIREGGAWRISAMRFEGGGS